MRKFLHDPLLHFLLLGAALFALFQWVADSTGDRNPMREIVITAGRIQALSQSFEKVWQRPATALELDGLIQEHIREEVLYREALAMGLDRDDTIVRRRLRQKMEFLSEDLVRLEEPSDTELQAFLTAHAERFRQESRFSFRQVYLNANKRDTSAEADARAMLVTLRGHNGDASHLGDRLMIPHRFEQEPEREVARALGKQFLRALHDTPLGSWQGPVVSGFGLHLVHISHRTEGKVPALAEVRDAVLREWSAAKRKQVNEAFYATLRARYQITVIKPTPPTSQQAEITEVAK